LACCTWREGGREGGQGERSKFSQDNTGKREEGGREGGREGGYLRELVVFQNDLLFVED
jgi:hypothetical protein